MQGMLELYRNYIDSDEYNKYGVLTEVQTAWEKIFDLIKDFDREDYLEIEGAIATHSTVIELQGFIGGYCCAAQLMDECVSRAVMLHE